MKLEDLTETPQLINKDLVLMDPMRPFYSQEALDRDFDFIAKGKISDGSEFWVVLKKTLSIAAIGIPGLRERDKKPGMEIISTLEFKNKLNLSGLRDIELGEHVLQVNLVRTDEKRTNKEFAFHLYLSLAKGGYVILSDNTQYIGGKALWKKIARETLNNKYKVYVIDHGAVMMKDDKPVVYDGSNIEDAMLWSEDIDKKYTLFALKAT